MTIHSLRRLVIVVWCAAIALAANAQGAESERSSAPVIQDLDTHYVLPGMTIGISGRKFSTGGHTFATLSGSPLPLISVDRRRVEVMIPLSFPAGPAKLSVGTVYGNAAAELNVLKPGAQIATISLPARMPVLSPSNYLTIRVAKPARVRGVSIHQIPASGGRESLLGAAARSDASEMVSAIISQAPSKSFPTSITLRVYGNRLKIGHAIEVAQLTPKGVSIWRAAVYPTKLDRVSIGNSAGNHFGIEADSKLNPFVHLIHLRLTLFERSTAGIGPGRLHLLTPNGVRPFRGNAIAVHRDPQHTVVDVEPLAILERKDGWTLDLAGAMRSATIDSLVLNLDLAVNESAEPPLFLRLRGAVVGGFMPVSLLPTKVIRTPATSAKGR